MSKNFYHYNELTNQAIINLRVKANAKLNSVDGLVMVNGQHYLKLSVKAIPEKGKANKEIINYLSKSWYITKDNLDIVKGHNNTFKKLLIKNIKFSYLTSILNF